MTTRSVVETNVAYVANGRDTHASHACQLHCVKMLEAVRHGVVVIDDRELIVQEYRRRLTPNRGPRSGDRFFKLLLDRRYNAKFVQAIPITPTDDDGTNFQEFPEDPRLATFDPDDRKFAAVARVAEAPVWNATDSDWAEHEAALRDNGIEVVQLCPEHATKND